MPDIAKRISPTPVAVLQRGGGVSLRKTHASAPAQNESYSGMDARRLHSERPPKKSPLAAKAIGLDRLAALNVFMRAADACSFTEAGRQLGLSSSAVGKNVARLEQRLAVELFHRNTRSVSLTHEGKAFLESCRRIFGIAVGRRRIGPNKRAAKEAARKHAPKWNVAGSQAGRVCSKISRYRSRYRVH